MDLFKAVIFAGKILEDDECRAFLQGALPGSRVPSDTVTIFRLTKLGPTPVNLSDDRALELATLREYAGALRDAGQAILDALPTEDAPQP